LETQSLLLAAAFHFPGTDLVFRCSHEKSPDAQDAKYVSWLVRATYDLR